MKNLQDYVDRVWQATTVEIKREILKEMIMISSASKKTKVLTSLQVDKTPLHKLDYLAVNYSLAGEGMKVI